MRTEFGREESMVPCLAAVAGYLELAVDLDCLGFSNEIALLKDTRR